jgi:hypothetical protein
MSRVDEAGGLLAEHLLLKMTMEKGVGDVHLVNRPAARHGELEHGADGPGLDNRGEGLSEINAGSLTKATNDPSRLMPIKSSIWIELVLEDPLPGDDVGMAWSRNKLPCLVAL